MLPTPPHAMHSRTLNLAEIRVETIVEILRRRATTSPEDTAFVQLGDLGEVAGSLDYAALDAHARTLGGYLQAQGLSGECGLLVLPEGLEFVKAFYGALYGGLIPAPLPAPDLTRLKRTIPRILAVARDAGAKAILAPQALLKDLAGLLEDTPELARLKMIAVDRLECSGHDTWCPLNPGSQAIAYLQYTSGSTLDPKGVMISHGNVAEHLQQVAAAYQISSRDILLSWVPHFHDYGLVEGILLPVHAGVRSHLLKPRAFLRRPLVWLKAISIFRVTHSQGAHFGYAYCLRRITPEQCAGLDLSCWRTASLGAEPILVETLKRFRSQFGVWGFKPDALAPSYGLAEATLLVSSPHRPRLVRNLKLQASAVEQRCVAPHLPGQGRGVWLANCGQAVPNADIRIVEPEANLECGDGTIGEIWVRSPGVALGYWNRPAETAQTFGARLRDTGEGPFLRTGDLGFLHHGELFVAGRLKDLIIIRGANHYPQDLEQTAEQSHPALRSGGAAAFALEKGGETQVGVVVEVGRGTDPAQYAMVLGALCQAISEVHEVPVAGLGLLRPGSLPKTSSGKLQRARCRELFLNGGPDLLAAWPSAFNAAAVEQGTVMLP